MLVGRAFHSLGPWTANLRSPLDLYLALGIWSRWIAECDGGSGLLFFCIDIGGRFLEYTYALGRVP